MKQFLFILLCSAIFLTTAKAQDSRSRQVAAANNCILFANESAHGLLIIHRLLEVYNQEVNKFVDLPAYQLNLFSNSDFPENIFSDESGSFYRVSPYELYDKAIKSIPDLPSKYQLKTSTIITEMRAILDELERERYAVGTMIANTDPGQKSNFLNIYNALDACAARYDLFEKKRNELSGLIEKMDLNTSKNQSFSKNFLRSFYAYSSSLHQAFDALRTENTGTAKPEMKKLQVEALKFQNTVDQLDISQDKLSKQQINVKGELATILKKQRGYIDAFVGGAGFPKEYELYGICYYTFNIQMAGTTNKYGTGVIERGNEWLKINGNNYIYAFERPHFYKVIRPKTVLEEKDTTLTATIAMPKVVENRQVIQDKSKTITTTDKRLLIEVFDHQEFDNDTISLNFNGTWILKKQLITKEPIRLYLTLVPGIENYLILYADNLGTRPPNTCAIRYENNRGKYNLVILNSDYKQSEMIIIKSASK